MTRGRFSSDRSDAVPRDFCIRFRCVRCRLRLVGLGLWLGGCAGAVGLGLPPRLRLWLRLFGFVLLEEREQLAERVQRRLAGLLLGRSGSAAASACAGFVVGGGRTVGRRLALLAVAGLHPGSAAPAPCCACAAGAWAARRPDRRPRPPTLARPWPAPVPAARPRSGTRRVTARRGGGRRRLRLVAAAGRPGPRSPRSPHSRRPPRGEPPESARRPPRRSWPGGIIDSEIFFSPGFTSITQTVTTSPTPPRRRALDVAVGHLADVDQAAVLQADVHEGAERRRSAPCPSAPCPA